MWERWNYQEWPAAPGQYRQHVLAREMKYSAAVPATPRPPASTSGWSSASLMSLASNLSVRKMSKQDLTHFTGDLLFCNPKRQRGIYMATKVFRPTNHSH